MEDNAIRRGTVDGIEDDWIYGWAYDSRKTAVQILLHYAGEIYQTIVCNQYRADLEADGIGIGKHGFKAPLLCDPSAFNPHLFSASFEDRTPIFCSEVALC